MHPLGWIARKRGQLRVAEAEGRWAVELAAEMGWLAAYPMPLTLLVGVLTDLGGLDEADELLETHGLSGSLPAGQAFDELLHARGVLRLGQGSTDRGIADLEELRDRLTSDGDRRANMRALLAKSLVPALVKLDRIPEARRIAAEALEVTSAFGQARFIAAAVRASALAQADGPDVDGLRHAGNIYERITAPVDLAQTLLELGAALRRRRQRTAAREPLRRALDLARAAEAHPLADRAEHELRASGGRPRRDRITGRDALTASETRVAQLALEGLTNRQIAESLFITRRTVESHLERIFRKLGIHSRSELEPALDCAKPSLSDVEAALP